MYTKSDFPKIYINISNFITSENEVLDFPIEIKKELKDERFEIKKPIRGKIKLFKSKREFFANFEIYTEIILICDRCLKKFKKPLNLNFTRSLKFNKESDEDIKIMPYNKIEIFEPIWQEIVLKIPIKSLCSQKCKGNYK